VSGGAPRPLRVEDPVFLVGSERSGSTLLSHMLDHHPQIAWALALEFAVAPLRAPGEWPALEAYREYLETSRIFQTSGLTIDPSLGYLDLVHDFLLQERNRKGRPLVGATVHRDFDRLLWLFPSCRFIHLVRDGRDVSHSAIGLGFVGNVWRGATWWVEAETLWSRLKERLPVGRFHEVRYEALVRSPQEVLGRICDFIGVPYAPQMLSYPTDTRYEPPDPQLAERWRRTLTPNEIRIVEAVAGPLLAERGYRLSGLPALHLGGLRLWWLRQHDRYRRVRFRVRREGLALAGGEFLARHLGWREAARSLQKRRNRIEMRYLR
jgi:hypothetical protein